MANNSFEVCTPDYSNYDPYLFTDPNNGTVWMFYSLENGGSSGTIEAQQLSADATSLIGSPSTLLTYAQASSLNPEEGIGPFLETPLSSPTPGTATGSTLSTPSVRSMGVMHTRPSRCPARRRRGDVNRQLGS